MYFLDLCSWLTRFFIFFKFRGKETVKRKSPNNSEQSKAKRLVFLMKCSTVLIYRLDLFTGIHAVSPHTNQERLSNCLMVSPGQNCPLFYTLFLIILQTKDPRTISKVRIFIKKLCMMSVMQLKFVYFVHYPINISCNPFWVCIKCPMRGILFCTNK